MGLRRLGTESSPDFLEGTGFELPVLGRGQLIRVFRRVLGWRGWVSSGRIYRDRTCQIRRCRYACADARWLSRNITSFPDMGLRRPSRGPVVDAIEKNRGSANRASRPS